MMMDRDMIKKAVKQSGDLYFSDFEKVLTDENATIKRKVDSGEITEQQGVSMLLAKLMVSHIRMTKKFTQSVLEAILASDHP